MKSVVIIDTPKGCTSCEFCRCRYQIRTGLQAGVAGFYCQLDKHRKVFEIPMGDETTKAKWCPLRPYKENKDNGR